MEPHVDTESGVEKLRWVLDAERGEGDTARQEWYDQMRAIFVGVINLGLACDTRVQL